MNPLPHALWIVYWAVLSINILSMVYSLWNNWRGTREFKKVTDLLIEDLSQSVKENIDLTLRNTELTHENMRLIDQISTIQRSN